MVNVFKVWWIEVTCGPKPFYSQTTYNSSSDKVKDLVRPNFVMVNVLKENQTLLVQKSVQNMGNMCGSKYVQVLKSDQKLQKRFLVKYWEKPHANENLTPHSSRITDVKLSTNYVGVKPKQNF